MESEWLPKKFGDLVCISAERCKASDATLDTYISTENMLPDFGGVTLASSLPVGGTVTRFRAGDTLFSNIRTYFRKVWKTEFDGQCSNDVLVLRPKSKAGLLPSYLHHLCRW